ncbi:protein ABSCISIC ACID-INSENSITIVE 5 [Punica granatum]|uniref:Protein ABSCISIC ACID-INSENSITIVE 5 n=1 Tax=Punica granatum TaxID=22663 RepID=A0A218XBD1_PUNGR|nr:protein ABSCISIC ACID-INSENSITIVE 5 [Punica granatum]OWM82525.1 hypothetical protein CDL15_Pgr002100 [Punica granatum]
MGVPEPDQMTPQGEAAVTVESHSIREPDHQSSKVHPFSSLGRQSSIYSLTLDEFQHALCESGKHFGSMNMDEFLSSIWTAEENQQAINSSGSGRDHNNNGNGVDHHRHVSGEVSSGEGIAKPHSLSRQASLSLPAPLCRKTVDEVWSEIHKSQQGNKQASNVNPESAPRQPTFGEMTLEDFLIKAGVVREQYSPPAPPQQQQQYGVFQNSNSAVGPSFVSRPMMGTGCLGGGPSVAYPAMPQGGGMMGETSGYANGKRDGGYRPAPPPVCYAPRVGNGSGGGGNGFGPAQPMGMGAPVSPVSSDGIGTGSADMGLDMGGMRSRKRIMDGPVDKVVERRQRRMIKNRESAARSRARKQAYTVELEAELNQLKEENAHLKQELAELERKRKQQYFEEVRLKTQNKANRARERLRMMRRNLSCPL